MVAAPIDGRPRKSYRAYNSWASMVQRCTNPNSPKFQAYGGRVENPIRIEDSRWLDFECFLRDMGERPEGTTIDRIDNGSGYSKANCRWATPLQQVHNRRPNVGACYGRGVAKAPGHRLKLAARLESARQSRTAESFERGWSVRRCL